jgi:hypothetical protein
MSENPRLGMNSKMPYGQYKDLTIGAIVKKDPDWLLWCRDNKGLAISDEVVEACVTVLESKSSRVPSGFQRSYSNREMGWCEE